MSKAVPLQFAASFHVVNRDNDTGEILYEFEQSNLVVKVGRSAILDFLFGTGSPSAFLYLGAGPCSTAATVDDTRLTYELIANASRKNPTVSAISTGTYTISGNTYYKTIQLQTSFVGASDSNVDETFREYALFDSDTLPGTPTSTSGRMLNHLIAPGDTVLYSSSTITVTINVYT